ncbi:MAG: aldo/keto reductase [Desulfobacterales bacterium]|jgi:aryl-alcohol dehydrogenase-like predicted oxidoreductase
MNYKLLGRSGLRVSEICLGAMTFGDDWGWGSSKADSRRIFDRFVDAGGNFVDTADLYTNGVSETYLGEFMAGRRDEMVLATKYANAPPGKDPNAGGNHRKNMMQSVEASLSRLKTDYIDLYWLHIWDFTTPIDEVMRAFDDLVSQGKILYIGISNAPAWVVSRANMLAELRGWASFAGLQIEYSLIERTPERELVPMARALDLAITAWSPLAGGILTGKYDNSRGADGDRRFDHPTMKTVAVIDQRKRTIVNAVMTVARDMGCTAAQVALSWLRSQPGVVIPIIGARRLSQLEDNLASVNIDIDDHHMEQLNAASRIELGFPHDFFHTPRVRQFAFGGMADHIDNHRPG